MLGAVSNHEAGLTLRDDVLAGLPIALPLSSGDLGRNVSEDVLDRRHLRLAFCRGANRLSYLVPDLV